MLLIRRETDYAIRILLHLATLPPDARVPAGEIARLRLVPPNLVRRITSRLAEAGLLKTYRGNKGGVSLARPTEEITFLEIIEAMEGPVILNQCVLEPQICPLVPDCPVHKVWVDTRRMLREYWARITLADIAGPAEERPLTGELSP